jgi:hypothetical protein
VPRRLTAIEQIVKGKPIGEDIPSLPARRRRGAKPLNSISSNPADANLVTRAVRGGGPENMELFRYATSIYGDSKVVIGASWNLLPWFVAVGAALSRACGVKAIAGRRGHAH